MIDESRIPMSSMSMMILRRPAATARAMSARSSPSDSVLTGVDTANSGCSEESSDNERIKKCLWRYVRR